ncbi:GNAT family N-acetyltransferase [Planctomicrobium piriforme]|uniref:Ribosomal-protein-alanine N-acetyltransferase n=1 Tax=Planctomicrobium piriforme TaxID=1576369 RepID=A0A1I3LS73_9PLAN|nr:GNAT family N-acetyltransferase [Planctomicrobium piriforme]SFI87296.1 ribosomal-protein-alanine N-acetyltransferase [Planctomicrobium piriforme]
MVIRETERLVLRELAPGDAVELFRIYSDPEVMRFMGAGPVSVEQERAGIESHIQNSYARHGYGLWGVVERESGTLIGRCGLLSCELHARAETEISYLLDRPYWRQGYASEACRAIMSMAFDELRLPRLLAFVAPANVASRRVAERLGCRQIGEAQYKQFGVVELFEGLRVEG